MISPKFTLDSNSTAEEILSAVRKLEIKPFATDFLKIGSWIVLAHACGYWLIKGDHRFGFSEGRAEVMVESLMAGLEGKTNFVTYKSGSRFLYVQTGEVLKSKVGRVRTANEFFDKALKVLDLNIMVTGTYSHMYGTDFSAMVAV